MSKSSTKQRTRTAPPDPVFDTVLSAITAAADKVEAHGVKVQESGEVVSPVVHKSKASKPGLPSKPYAKFPLTPHPSGAWQKKILGKIKYFGRWGRIRNGKMERLPGDGWKEALELYQAQADDLHAGRTPRVRKTGEGLKLYDLLNHFLTAKKRKLTAGEITAPTFEGHKQITDLLIAQFGKDRPVDDIAADDFGTLRAVMAERWGPVRLGNHVRYGPEFKKPSASVLRRQRARNGPKMLEAAELRRLLDALDGQEVETGRKDEAGKSERVTVQASPTMRAMVLLGVNCAFNNKDFADLPLDALDLDGGWIDFARTKTGIPRRCPLWVETVAALRAAIAARPEPREASAEGLVFLTARGRQWLCRGQANPVSVLACKAMKAVNIHRKGIGSGTLRHVFRTVADGSRDQVATNHIMGHADNSMADHYRERIDDNRLKAVTDYVRNWLLGSAVQ